MDRLQEQIKNVKECVDNGVYVKECNVDFERIWVFLKELELLRVIGFTYAESRVEDLKGGYYFLTEKDNNGYYEIISISGEGLSAYYTPFYCESQDGYPVYNLVKRGCAFYRIPEPNVD